MRSAVRPLLSLVATFILVAGCSGSSDNAFDWASKDLILLSSTGTSSGFERDHGTLWGVSVDRSLDSLSTSGIENGQMLIQGDVLHFDDRENSLTLTAGSENLVAIPRDRHDYLVGMVGSAPAAGVVRVFNDGYGDDGGAYQSPVFLERGLDTESGSLEYFAQSLARCEGQVFVVGADWRDDADTARSPLALLEITGVAPSLIELWEDSAGRVATGPMGCVDGRPRWVEYVDESDHPDPTGVGRESIVGLAPTGGLLRTMVGNNPDTGRPSVCGESPKNWTRQGELLDMCIDGRMQSVDLETGEISTVLDARNLLSTEDGQVLSYPSDTGFVALGLDYVSGDAILGTYDESGRELQRSVYKGLSNSIGDSDEALYDFIAVSHPPIS